MSKLQTNLCLLGHLPRVALTFKGNDWLLVHPNPNWTLALTYLTLIIIL